MEYDRALFRVYERILDDLNASPSPLATYARDYSISHRGRRHVRDGDITEGVEAEDTSDIILNSDSNVSSDQDGESNLHNERAMARRHTRRQRNRQSPSLNVTRHFPPQINEMPFFLPIGLTIKLNEKIRSFSNRHSGVPLLHDGEDAPLTPTRYRSLLVHSTSPASHTSDDDEEQAIGDSSALNIPRLSHDDSPRGGLRRRTASSPRTSPSGSISVSSSASSDSLTSPPLSLHSPPGMLQPRNSSSSDENTYISSSSEEDLPSTNNDNNRVVSTSLAQRSIQMQLSQRQRFQRSNHTSEDASDDESLDNESTEQRQEGYGQKNLYRVMRFTFGLGIFHLIILMVLHVTYVGPHAFRRQNDIMSWAGLFTTKTDSAEESEVLFTCIARALANRPNEERSQYNILFGEDGGKRRRLGEIDMLDFSIDDGFANASSESLDVDLYYEDDDIPWWRSRLLGNTQAVSNKSLPPLPLLGKDEILQIKILYGRKYTDQSSTVRYVEYPNSGKVTEKARLFQQRPAVVGRKTNKTENDSLGSHLRGEIRQVRTRKLTTETASTEQKNSTTESNTFTDQRNSSFPQNEEVDELSSPEFWEDPTYRFAIDDALLYLDENSIYLHNITTVNVTLTERCLSTGSDDGKLTFITAVGEFLSQIYGMDSIIINQLMFGIRSVDGSPSDGHIQNMKTRERWGWRKDQIELFDQGTSVLKWLPNKLGILFMSLLSFFLITSVTALIVRVLTSSGVVLMFPLFELFRNAGVSGADEQILALSYPWIGAARRAIRNNNTHPQSHLVWAHMTKIVLYYIMYEACQAAWSVVLYAKCIPEALPVWIYGLAMIIEYFSMVFVRSIASVHFFPRITLLYFMAYHFYFYSVSYGYFDLALIPLALFMAHAMLFTVFLEAPNASRGIISAECPREAWNALGWNEWSSQLPSEWTIFLPLNSRQTPLHDRQAAELDAQTTRDSTFDNSTNDNSTTE